MNPRTLGAGAALFAILSIVTSCQAIRDSTAEQQIATACAASSAALKTLTIANEAGRLSVETQAGIMNVKREIDPVCLSPTPPTLDSLRLRAFERAIAYLTEQAANVGGAP